MRRTTRRIVPKGSKLYVVAFHQPFQQLKVELNIVMVG